MSVLSPSLDLSVSTNLVENKLFSCLVIFNLLLIGIIIYNMAMGNQCDSVDTEANQATGSAQKSSRRGAFEK
jgi:hypothetical protein